MIRRSTNICQTFLVTLSIKLLEPRPVYMDPPRIKTYESVKLASVNADILHGYSAIFYGSLIVLTGVSSSMLVYVYILQVRYKSEKFRFETPFFHKRDETAIGNESLTN